MGQTGALYPNYVSEIFRFNGDVITLLHSFTNELLESSEWHGSQVYKDFTIGCFYSNDGVISLKESVLRFENFSNQRRSNIISSISRITNIND